MSEIEKSARGTERRCDKNTRQIATWLLVGMPAVLWLAQLPARCCGGEPVESQYPDPTRFAEEVARFEAEDAKQAPPRGAIVCAGSSTMRMWHPHIREDLAPLTVVPRGFGGSTMYDLLHYAEPLVLKHQPRAVVIYEGDNDVAAGVEPTVICDTFEKFVGLLHQRSPKARVYFLAIKPSGSRWSMWPRMQEANRLIAEVCRRDERLTYVDIAQGLLDDDGQVREELFIDDRLHLNRAGYNVLRDILKPVLAEHEMKFEPQQEVDASVGN